MDVAVWVSVFCCERAKRNINRAGILIFKQHISHAYDPDNVRFPNVFTKPCWMIGKEWYFGDTTMHFYRSKNILEPLNGFREEAE